MSMNMTIKETQKSVTNLDVLLKCTSSVRQIKLLDIPTLKNFRRQRSEIVHLIRKSPTKLEALKIFFLDFLKINSQPLALAVSLWKG